MMLTRRRFIANLSLGLAALPRGTSTAAMLRLSHGIPEKVLPEWVGDVSLRRLATEAIDAARAAGAHYADVRLAHWQRLDVPGWNAELRHVTTFGIRASVHGAWAFVHGVLPTTETVARAAMQAAARASRYARVLRQPADLAPAPVVTGNWATPIVIDPFTVPIDEQIAAQQAFSRVTSSMHGADAGWQVAWTRELRVFASTEGSLVTQRVYRTFNVSAEANVGFGGISIEPSRLSTDTPGYEAINGLGVQERVLSAEAEALQLTRIPVRTLDMGRYPAVCDGAALGAIFGMTLGPALELDRVLGTEIGASGSSLLAPAEHVLGAPLFSPLLNITSGRNDSPFTSIGWDDEGVVPTEFSVIERGSVVDYLTSRNTAPALSAWYSRQGRAVQSHGCAVAPTAGDPVTVRPRQLRVAAGTERCSLKDLCKDISHGVLIRGAPAVDVDFGGVTGFLPAPALQLFEIRRGQIVARIRGSTAVRFKTRSLLQGLIALGDVNTTQSHEQCREMKGIPWTSSSWGVEAPAGLLKEIDVVQEMSS